MVTPRRAVRFYADSAEPARVLPLLRAGLVRGVTTNPTILDRADRGAADLAALYRAFVDAGADEVFFQAWGADTESLSARAERIVALGDRVVVKVPATVPGLGVATALVDRGVPVLVTAVNTVAHALLAAQAGARYVAPYFGQIADRTGEPPLALLADLHDSLDGTGTDVLLASIRTPAVVEQAARVGVRLFTAHPDVVEACATDAHTAAAVDAFEAVMARRG